MKKVLLLGVFVLLVGTAAFGQFVRGGSAWVSAKTVNLKSSTWFFARTNGRLAYGDQVTIVQVSGKWAEVRSASGAAVSGWVSTANLSSRRIVSTGSTSSATASETAMAGKGFNQEVENAYKTEGDLNYADIDRTEAVTVSDDDLLRFIQEGHLAGGAQQ